MPRFAANISTLYTEHPFLDRIGAAARDGFEAVECQFPYAHAAAEIAQRLADHALTLVLLNAPPGGTDERGIACLPGREAEFRRGFEQALHYAQVLGCPRIHAMAGRMPPGTERARLQATYEANLAWAAQQAGSVACDVLIEPLNPRDVPGYLLSRQDQAHAVVQAIGAANLKVQMDLYHCQIVEGDVAMKLREYLPSGRVGHLQIAGVPERHEPDIGELNHRYLFALIDELGWSSPIGCEYRPRAGTSAGLGWFAPYRPAGRPGSLGHVELVNRIGLGP
jgi:hydroxypyruvate isomerase